MDFKSSSGRKAKNIDLIFQIRKEMDKRDIEINWIKAHVG